MKRIGAAFVGLLCLAVASVHAGESAQGLSQNPRAEVLRYVGVDRVSGEECKVRVARKKEGNWYTTGGETATLSVRLGGKDALLPGGERSVKLYKKLFTSDTLFVTLVDVGLPPAEDAVFRTNGEFVLSFQAAPGNPSFDIVRLNRNSFTIFESKQVLDCANLRPDPSSEESPDAKSKPEEPANLNP